MKKRQIKFRLWDTVAEVMLPHNEINYGNAIDLHKNEPTVFLLQFTGLKDKNGLNIYEGDIVKWGLLNEYSRENPPRIGIVKIDPDIQFYVPGMKYTFHFSTFAYQNTILHLEIIGNIFENPKLLES